MSSKGANFIDFLLIPLVMGSYYQALSLTALLKLNTPYFYLILFLFIHLFSSITTILSNYVSYHKFKPSMFLLGFGPTVSAFIFLTLTIILPFFKWPFYILKWIPNFDFWITPIMMGFAAFFVQIILRKTLGEALYTENQSLSLQTKSNDIIMDKIN